MTYNDFEYEYTDDGAVKITRYMGKEKHIAIPSKIDGRRVTAIGKCAFENSDITSIEIPDSIEKIFCKAFVDCKVKKVSITNISKWCKVEFGDDVFGYGYDLYLNGEMVTEVFISTEVQNIGCVFANCDSIKRVEIQDGVKNIAPMAFSFCKNLESIVIPNSVTGIGRYAFAWCSNLSEINLPSGITEIAEQTFAWCRSLAKLQIPFGVEYIGDFAFSNCVSLTSINIPSSVKIIGLQAFDWCRKLKGVYIADLVSWCNIQFNGSTSNPLYYARNLYLNDNLVKDLIIQNEIKAIRHYAFVGSDIETLTLQDGVEEIMSAAFNYCAKLRTVNLSSVKHIDSYSFYNCISLQNITVDGKNEFYSNDGNCLIDKKTKTLMLGCNNSVIPNWVEIIGPNAFESCARLKNILIPSGVTKIEESAFEGCINLTNIELPIGVTHIGPMAFENCSNLQNISIPHGVTEIGSNAFDCCEKLIKIIIPSTVTYIGSNAFDFCNNLTIYCQAEREPIEWNLDWNWDDRPVVWGYKED